MKTTEPLFVLRLDNIHFAPHSPQAAALIKRKAKSEKMSLRDYRIEETSLMLVMGIDPEKPSDFAPTP